MKYLDCYAEVSSDNVEIEQENGFNHQVSLDNFIDDDPQIENNLSDYYGLTNITRLTCDVKEDTFSEMVVEAGNYCLCYED